MSSDVGNILHVILCDYSVTSELLVCNTSPNPAVTAVPSLTMAALSGGTVRRSPLPAAAADSRLPSLSRHHPVIVVIDDTRVSSDAATFTYVEDPVVTDVVNRDSILRSVYEAIQA